MAAWHAAYRGRMPDEVLDRFTLEVRDAAWRRNLGQAEGPRTTVLERDGRPIAFASVGACRDDARLGEVWALYAAPEAWGTGAGRALLDDGLRFLAAQGYRGTMLWVLEGNARAIRFYEAAGFALDGEPVEKDAILHHRMVR